MAALMHADEVVVDQRLVRRLLEEQLPQWAGEELVPVLPTGTDNAIFRLGADLAVRVPRIPSAGLQVAKEQRWLPLIAPLLPLPVPVPIAMGAPGPLHPWPWSVCRWVAGEPVAQVGLGDGRDAARTLAGFVQAMRGVDLPGGPGPGDHNFGRGRPLQDRDGYVRDALRRLDGEVDVAAAAASWEESLAAAVWDGPPTWIHGDLHETNVLVDGGTGISAVVDFGGLGVGDPACDVMAAWTVLGDDVRDDFLDALGTDEATRLRARGWALSMGLIALPYYLSSSPTICAQARRWIAQVVEDR